jgi:4-hydroxybenzoate polyprenyltransferase
MAMNKFRHWFELCRLPNSFTAMADPLAGALIVGAGWRHLPGVLLLMLAGACLYTGGIVLNDCCDYQKDLTERPDRPLPSKKVKRYQATLVAVLLLIIGVLLARYVGRDTGRIALLLIVAIMLYDVILKNIPLGPLVMGLCRSLNLLMGMAIISAAESPATVALRGYLVVAMGVYIAGLTLFARKEAVFDQGEKLTAGAVITLAAIAVLPLTGFFFPEHDYHVLGNFWTIALIAAVGYYMIKAIKQPAPEHIQRAVKTAVLGVIVFDAAMVALLQGVDASLLVIILLIPAVKLGKRLYST